MPLVHPFAQPNWATPALLLALILCNRCLATSADLAVVSLFAGERKEPLNQWGGAWNVGTVQAITLESRNAHGGKRALEIELGEVEAGEHRYVQCFVSGFGPTRDYYQTRDLQRYERLEFWVRNDTGVALNGFLQVKDYRDSESHRAMCRYSLPAEANWTRIQVPLRLDAAAWTVDGEPDLSRVLALGFLFEPHATLHGGTVALDDIILVEPGGPVDIATAPLSEIVERLARRQWDGLWSARSRAHGMIPNNSYQATDAGLNATAAVLWMLPAATRRGWVEPEEADRYVEMLLETLGALLDRAKHVPPRNVDWVNLRPSLLPEESSVDAAFLALALHRYKTLPTTSPALSDAINHVQERFNFAAFACPAGWRMAYRYASRFGAEGLVSLTYDGYTSEGNLVSLAAHLSESHHVPIDTFWNTNVHRVRTQFASLRDAPVVHSWKEFRAPFVQALFNLFVDVRHRGVDSYPDQELATNPWQNFVCYQQHVMTRLAELGRPYLVQPDAGDDGTLANYQQFSVYESFGQADLFMPWSSAFALLAGADRAEPSLRYLLRHGLHGPLGLTDSARWQTGAPEPYAVTARHDFWNTALGTMALLEWLDGESRSSKSFSELPEVEQALGRVFPAVPKHPAPAAQPQRAGAPRVMAVSAG
jgi:hypothetical protein